jgi:hypothetical protein
MFNTNLRGRKEVTLVRIPDPLSLETMQPILFSRQWEDFLYYDIIVGGRSFPIGSMIPIFLRLGPLDKVQVHGFEVLVTESIEYSSNNKKVIKRTPSRTVLLLKKTAEKAIFPSWATSGLVRVRDGEFTPEPRNETCEMATEQRSAEASGERTLADTVTERRDSLLFNSDLDLPTFWGTTEIEAAVQIPTCGMMLRRGELRLHPKCIWKNVVAKHCLKVNSSASSRPALFTLMLTNRSYCISAFLMPITRLRKSASIEIPSHTCRLLFLTVEPTRLT